MGAFFLVKHNSQIDSEHAISKLKAQFTQQGFSSPQVVSTTEYDLYVYSKIVTQNKNIVHLEDNDYCASTGTLIYKSQIGIPALTDCHKNHAPGDIAPADFYGAFCLITSKQGKTHLQIDPLGIYKVYKDSTDTIWSSSFLGVASALSSNIINTQSVYEYVFQGATYGDETLFEAISLLEANKTYEIGQTVSITNRNIEIGSSFVNDSLSDHLENNSSNLYDYYSAIKNCFGDNVDTALSGGFDSRLTLSLLHQQDITPKVHVYGKPNDDDVLVASNIDKFESLDLKHIDKSNFPEIGLNEFPDLIAKNFVDFDAYPCDGIFDNGQDIKSRTSRCANDELMLNGGGGEIFRNFFYLWDKTFSLKGFLWSFYSRFDPKACSNKFNEATYYFNLGAKIKKTLKTDKNKLSRAEIELVYPLFRCRYWMGKNNSINNKLGYALTPFIDYNIVFDAMKIPLKYKNYGNFEGKLINLISPRLAKYPSAYGYSFNNDAPLKNRLKELATYIRPSYLRKYSYRIQTRQKKLDLPYYLTAPYRKAIQIDEFEYMNNYFDLNTVRDTEQYRRICTLEYLFNQLDPTISKA